MCAFLPKTLTGLVLLAAVGGMSVMADSPAVPKPEGQSADLIKEPLQLNAKVVTFYAFHPDGKTLVYNEGDVTGQSMRCQLVQVDLASGKELQRSTVGTGLVQAGVFSPDGKYLALGPIDRGPYLWDVALWKEHKPLKLPQGAYGLPLAFSLDGKKIGGSASNVNAGLTENLVLWDAETGQSRFLGLSPNPAQGMATNGSCPVALNFADDGGPFLFVERHFFAPIGQTMQEGSAVTHVWDIDQGKPLPIELMEVWKGSPLQYWSRVGRGVPVPGMPADRYRFRVTPGGRVVLLPKYKSPPLAVLLHDDGIMALVATPSGDRFGTFVYPGGPEPELCRLTDFKEWKSVSCLLSPDGKKLLAAGQDPRNWKAESGFKMFVWDVSSLHPAAAKQIKIPGPKDLDKALAVALEQRPDPKDPVKFFWQALADEITGRAHPAMAALVAHPTEAVPLLRDLLGTPPDAKQIARFIEELGHPKFVMRELASYELKKIGLPAEMLLKQELAKSPGLEVKMRIKELLDTLASKGPAQELRGVRIVDVLEHINTADARDLLATIAQGGYGDGAGKSAQAALKRLGK